MSQYLIIGDGGSDMEEGVLHNGISSSWIVGKDAGDGDERADGETSMGIKSFFLSDDGAGLQLWTKDELH